MSAAVLDGPLLLDGAMGTALLARGLGAALPEEWLLSRPEEIARVHAEHAAAGARLLLTCTFSCASPRLAARLDPASRGEVCARAVRLARDAGAGALVAGAVGPTGLADPAAPPPARAELAARYAPPLEALAAAGVDLLWIESQWDLAEARAALAVARRSGLPTVVTFTFAERAGSLVAPDGRPAEECLAAVAADGAVAAGVNCVFAGPALTALAGRAAARLPVPFVAKPSPGLPGAVLSPASFAALVRPAVAAGLRALGGCCGATGDHLRAIGPLLSAPS